MNTTFSRSLLSSSLSITLALTLTSCGRGDAPPPTAAPPEVITTRTSALVTPGSLPSINVSTPPAVRAILGSDNKVTAVGLKANGDVQAVHQDSAGGTAFTASTVPAITATSIPWVAESFDAQLVIMARTTTGTPNIVQRSTGPITGPFSAWTSDAGDFDATTGAGLAALGPTMVLNSSGFMEAFIADVNGRTERKTKTAASPTSWTTWAEQGSGVIRSEPVPVKRANGVVSLVARTEANGLALQTQTTAGSWTGSSWTPFAGAIVVGTPTAVLNAGGAVTLIMLGYGADKTSGYAAVAATQNGATWDWAYVGGNAFTSQAAVKDGNGKIRIFTLNGARQLQQIVQNGTTWAAATVVSTTPLTSAPAAVVNGNGDVEVFARFDDKSLNRIVVPKTGSASAWTAVGSGLTWSLPAEDPPSPLTAVTTQHNDTARTGANLGEAILNTGNVNQYQFGKLFSYKVDGLVFAQPLYVPNVTVAGTSRNLLLVATMRNKLYAFDADSTSGTAPLWTLDLGFNGGQGFPAPVFPNVSFGNNGCACPVIFQNLGITSTPVVDPATNTAYLVAMGVVGAPMPKPIWATNEVDNRCPQYHTTPLTCALPPNDNPVTDNENFSHKIFSVDLTNGWVKTYKTLSPTYTCPANPPENFPCESNPTVSVGQTITFKSRTQLQRAALLLSSGKVYVAFAGLNDRPPFHGWLTSVNASDLTPQNTFVPVPVRKIPRGNTNPDFIPYNGGGIWQSGEGPAADAAGNVYVETGNGPFDADVGGVDFGNSLLKLSPTLARLDWFAPKYNFLSTGGEITGLGDIDLASGGPLLLPGNRVLASGKMGIFHLADTSTDAFGQGRLGRFNTGAGNVDGNVQNLSVARNVEDGNCDLTYGFNSRNMANIHGSPVFWDDPKSGGLVYVMGEQDHARALRYSFATSKFTDELPTVAANSHSDPAACACRGGMGSFPTYNCAKPESYSTDKAPSGGPTNAALYMPGGILSVSARGNWGGSGVLWGIRPTWDNATWKIVAGTLIAWDAQDLQKQIWSSDAPSANNLDSKVGLLAKFVPPTVANGRVYMATFNDAVGTQNEVVVYGLFNSVR